MNREEFSVTLLNLIEQVNEDFPKQASVLGILGMATLVGADTIITELDSHCYMLSRMLTLALFRAHPEFLDGFREYLDERDLEYSEDQIRSFAGLDPGAVNISGLAHSLGDWIGLIEADVNEWDRDVEGAIFDIKVMCQQAWNKGGTGTRDVNTNKHVVEHVGRLAEYAFNTDEMRRVACHPIIRLIVSQMAQLSGIVIGDPHYLSRWGDAYDAAKEMV